MGRNVRGEDGEDYYEMLSFGHDMATALMAHSSCTRLGYQHEWQRGLCCPSLPEELLADGDCWRKGVTVFSGVASGKLAML